jgi:hypothetical protein
MNPQHRQLVENFVNDPIVYPLVLDIVKRKLDERKNNAVTRIMSYPSLPTPLRETNEEIGAELMVVAEATHMVETIFRELALFERTPVSELAKNPAR